jgi:hypothetical protein
MKDEIIIEIHAYNHFAMDIVNDIMRITSAAHKYNRVIIDTLTEPFDIRQIPWKGETKLLEVLKILCDTNNWSYKKFHIVSWNPAQPKSTWPSMEYTSTTQVGLACGSAHTYTANIVKNRIRLW